MIASAAWLPEDLWADPRLIYTVAIAAVVMLVTTVWLFRRSQRSGRQAAFICLVVSVGLHALLILFVPAIREWDGTNASEADSETSEPPGIAEVAVAVFDPALNPDATSSPSNETAMTPLPVGDLSELLDDINVEANDGSDLVTDEIGVSPGSTELSASPVSLASLSGFNEDTESTDDDLDQWQNDIDDWLAESLEEEPSSSAVSELLRTRDAPVDGSPADQDITARANAAPAPTATTPGSLKDEFASRVGQAKRLALRRTGGDATTEAAVAEALRFLARHQRPDGGFDSLGAGGGQERRPLGESRRDPHGTVAGSRADSATTGLALLAMIGAGHTHQRGDYSSNVYKGLVYLIRRQRGDGSLAGDATLYARNYCHGMAGLAMGEVAAISEDVSAVEATRRAFRFTQSMQHPVTGGFRYTPGDPGDVSQLGWQAMVIDAANRSGIRVDQTTVTGLHRFLRSVRAGRTGGLAGYRPGEKPSRTMTAEALATRLLLGERVPAAEIFEAEQFLLEQPPGVGQDNYYYWYYATLALHQLQDAAWRHWNDALKKRLLATQNSDGSWPTDSVWGGYGGHIYTTAMATLCLETYYRHRINGQP